MAKRPIVVDQDTKDFLDELGKEIAEKLNGQFFEVDGTPMSTVKYADGTFKKKTLIAGWNFSVEYCYVGVRGMMQFGLSPEDAQEYEFAEMNGKEVDDAFPLIGPAVAKHYGIEAEKLTTVIDQVITKRASEKHEADEKAKVEADQNYGELPTFGMF